MSEPRAGGAAAGGAGPPQVEVLGIRHHGPGSARAVRSALDRLQPQVVLIEGPADASPLTAFVSDPRLVPPVALLAYQNGTPQVAAFWPFAVFSPEWQAMRWAAAHRVPVRFCDLPSSAVLSPRPDPSTTLQDPNSGPMAGALAGAGAGGGGELRRDPIAAMAAAAGYGDPERWWDDVVESRLHAPAPFDVITDAMRQVRDATPPAPGREQEQEDRREAYMRQTLRTALKDGATRVAVVCGAWHAPALTGTLPSASADAKLLRGLPKHKTAVTWVPWTASRLSYASGYGAGITSPGWYHHLFATPDQVVASWLTKVARVLREHDLPVSSAHVIEAVRLADALAGLRGRPLAGLDEVTEATRAVLCDGDEASLALVTGKLVVGEAMGGVPESVPTVPLEADLRATARRLRLKLEPLARTLDLDLRRDLDLSRSHLLHRLAFLGIAWGVPGESMVASSGTFRETWSVRWHPEFAVDIVEAAMWGTTVPAAAAAKAIDAAQSADLPELTRLVEHALLADLAQALTGLLDALDERAARDLDAEHLMSALPPLVRAQRYSDVRGTDTGQLEQVVAALLVRICAALPAAVTGLDDDAARTLRTRLDAVHEAVLLRDDTASTDQWLRALDAVAPRSDIAGLLAGRITRLLRDTDRISTAEAARRLGLNLSIGTPATTKAGWVEGFLDGGGLILVHDRDLLALLDRWVAALPGQDFTDVLPLLRRTFGAFPAPERRALGDAARRGPGSARPAGPAVLDLDDEQAAAALATVALILGAPA
jgi:hypothetical protein